MSCCTISTIDGIAAVQPATLNELRGIRRDRRQETRTLRAGTDLADQGDGSRSDRIDRTELIADRSIFDVFIIAGKTSCLAAAGAPTYPVNSTRPVF